MLKNETAFLSEWSWIFSNGCLIMVEALLPKSSIISMARLLKEPTVCIAVGANMCVVFELEYLIVIVLAAALFAASPVCDDVNQRMYPRRSRSKRQGIRVMPSDRLPSLCKSPTGSLLDGVSVRKIAR